MVNRLFNLQTKGINKRKKVFADSWALHLQSSKEISLKAIEPKLREGKRLTILGAGELLDFPAELYSKYSKQITLVDRSKLALKTQEKNTVIYDITGTLETWYSLLNGLSVTKPEDLLIPLQSIATTHPLLFEPCFRDEVLLSLNILSQLPVYWQNSVFEIFSRKLSEKVAKELELTIIKALIPSFKALIISHLNTLIPEGRHKESILITDTHYISYALNTKSEAPLHLDLGSMGIQELDVKPSNENDLAMMEAMDALFQVRIGEELCSRCKVTLLDKWLWDIIPYGQEEKGTGTMHRVVALKIERLE